MQSWPPQSAADSVEAMDAAGCGGFVRGPARDCGSLGSRGWQKVHIS